MLQELHQKNVNWVILGDIPLDGRDELQFKNTHSLLWQHFQDELNTIEYQGLPDNYKLMPRKLSSQN